MQIKPRFENFKIKERHEVLKDDTGTKFYLTRIEVYVPSDKSEITITPYEFWCVMGDRMIKWSNKKVVSFSSLAFWKDPKRDSLIDVNINGIKIKEVPYSGHYIFCTKKMPIEADGDYGISTTFEITIQN